MGIKHNWWQGQHIVPCKITSTTSRCELPGVLGLLSACAHVERYHTINSPIPSDRGQHWKQVLNFEALSPSSPGCRRLVWWPLSATPASVETAHSWNRLRPVAWIWCIFTCDCRLPARTCCASKISTTLTYLLTNLGLSACRVYRPSTTVLHHSLFDIIFCVSLLLYPDYFPSLSVPLCQVFLTLSLLPFSGSFHVTPYWMVFVAGFLGVWSVYLHFLFFMFYFTVDLFIHIVLDTLSDHFRCWIMHRHLLKKDCTALGSPRLTKPKLHPCWDLHLHSLWGSQKVASICSPGWPKEICLAGVSDCLHVLW